jgi:putative membrane protein insertion efficiency factor
VKLITRGARRKAALPVLAAALILLGLDARLAVAERPSTHLALAAVHAYQSTLSRIYARMGVQCRFVPSCSRYAEATLGALGIWSGGWRTMKRVIRCGPWTSAGTVDPPPEPVRTADAHPL